MLILYDFNCQDCGHTQEALVPRDTDAHVCEVCQGNMTRLISPVRCRLDGTDPGFPGAHDKWARQHEQAGKAEPK